MDFAQTSNWDSWATITEDLPLAAGANSIKLEFDSESGDTGYVNIDNIYVPFLPDIAAYEAESAALHNGPARATNHWYYSGSGFAAGIEQVGSSVEFRNVTVPTSGTYDMSLRYANGNGTEKTLNVYVNGTYSETASLSSPSTDWNSWQNWEGDVQLNAGQNTIAFVFDNGNSGYVNLDKLEITNDAAAEPGVEVNLLDNGGFERPTWESSNWTEWHPDGQTQAYGVDKGIGMNPPETAKEGEQRAYFYLSSPYQQSIHQVNNVSEGTYRLEFWARCFNTVPTTARAEITCAGSQPTYCNIAQSSEWRHYEVSGLNLTGSVDIGFYVDSPGGTTLQIDGVRLIRD